MALIKGPNVLISYTLHRPLSPKDGIHNARCLLVKWGPLFLQQDDTIMFMQGLPKKSDCGRSLDWSVQAMFGRCGNERQLYTRVNLVCFTCYDEGGFVGSYNFDDIWEFLCQYFHHRLKIIMDSILSEQE